MEQLPAPSEPGSVVLDIGGDIGAAIVAAPASLAGVEIEIRPRGAIWDGTHVAVRARHLADRVMHAAVFESLPQGGYEVRVRTPGHQGLTGTFEVEGGRVTTAELW